MKIKIGLVIVLWFAAINCLVAQTEPIGKSKIIDRTDYITFHRQMLGLKEYTEERSKIPSLQKANKVTVKVKIIVDTLNNNDGEDETVQNKITGYIRQEIGDNSVNLYEITYDRVKKKITAVIPTGDSISSQKLDKKLIEKQNETKKLKSKKDKDEEDDEEDEEKPSKIKDKDKDKDKEEDN